MTNYLTPSQKLRRDLADTAVPVERRVWRLRNYAMQYHVSAFDLHVILRDAPPDLVEAVADLDRGR